MSLLIILFLGALLAAITKTPSNETRHTLSKTYKLEQRNNVLDRKLIDANSLLVIRDHDIRDLQKENEKIKNKEVIENNLKYDYGQLDNVCQHGLRRLNDILKIEAHNWEWSPIDEKFNIVLEAIKDINRNGNGGSITIMAKEIKVIKQDD